jgi:hypothetical protein
LERFIDKIEKDLVVEEKELLRSKFKLGIKGGKWEDEYNFGEE